MMRPLQIWECQPEHYYQHTDCGRGEGYRFGGKDSATGLYRFVTREGKQEWFSKHSRKLPMWHLVRGKSFYEFVRSVL